MNFAKLSVLLGLSACVSESPPPASAHDEIDLAAGEEQRLGAHTGLVPCSEEPAAQGCARPRPKASEPQPASPPSTSKSSLWRVPVEPGDPSMGPGNALVTVVVFSDFQCPFCKQTATSLHALVQDFPADVRLIWKDDPLPHHDRATPAALFARFAQAKQGDEGFWGVHALLYASQPALEDSDFERIADHVRLPWKEAKRAIASGANDGAMKLSMELSRRLDLRSVPTVFINGTKFEGAKSEATLRKAVDEQLAAAQRALDAGAPRDNFYDHWIESGTAAGGT